MNAFRFAPLALAATLTACVPSDTFDRVFDRNAGGEVQTPSEDTTRPEARPEAAGAPLSALSVEAQTQVETPVGTLASGDGSSTAGLLGTETATLGDASQPGLWVLTRHVTATQPGSVLATVNGNRVDVELRPSGGAGGRLSLDAMRALGLSLTSLAEIEVYGAN